MESGILKEMVSVIRAEQQRRESLRTDEGPEAYYAWCFENEPIINELCLMLLVTLRHQIERELVWLAGLAADDGHEISFQQHDERVKELKGKGRISWDWKKIEKRLRFKSCEGFKYVEALRHLANSYKHDPSVEPAGDLIEFLDLPSTVRCAPLPQSDRFREKLATFIGLEKHAPYCDIAEHFIDIADAFLERVKAQVTLSKLKPQVPRLSDIGY
ncbi:MAG TPA: hypothetical protein VF789_19890 [Thermoanaerobaculia bacterium]